MKTNQSIKLIKSWTLVCLVLLGVCLNSCAFEESKSLSVDSAEDALVTFAINTSSSATPSAFASDYSLESEVKDVSVLVFNTDNTFYYTANGVNIKNENRSTKTFDVRLPTGTWHLMVLANARTQKGTLSELKEGMSLDKAVEKLLIHRKKEKKWNPSASDFCVPMWGNIAMQTIDENTSSIEVSLVRMLAKVEVTLAESVKNFELTSVSLYNYYTQGKIIPTNYEDACWTSGHIDNTYPSVDSHWEKEKGPLSYPAINNACVGLIYTFEAEKGTKENHINNTCLVIGGKYKEQQTETYYRVDFANYNGMQVANYLDVLRNHNYEVDILGVSSSGFIDKEDALESTVVNITATVTPWIDMMCENVIYCGAYYMAFSTRSLQFKERGEKLEVIIHTNLKESEIKITRDSTSNDFSWNFNRNVKETEEYTLTVTSNSDSISPSQHIIIEGKSLRVKIGVS